LQARDGRTSIMECTLLSTYSSPNLQTRACSYTTMRSTTPCGDHGVLVLGASPLSLNRHALAIAEYEDRNPPFHAYPPVLHNQGARGCRRLGREEFRCRAGKKAHTGTESNRDECMMVTEFDVCERRVLRFWSLWGVQSMWRFEWS